MAKTTDTRNRKASSTGKPVMKQPTPINENAGVSPNNTPAAPAYTGIEEEIRRRAYELYQERGRQDGFEQEDWARAETEILGKYQRGKSA
jgi:hypothetical protein